MKSFNLDKRWQPLAACTGGRCVSATSTRGTNYIAELLERPPACLWARRSLFVRRGSRLLVTEAFLPAMLELRS